MRAFVRVWRLLWWIMGVNRTKGKCRSLGHQIPFLTFLSPPFFSSSLVQSQCLVDSALHIFACKCPIPFLAIFVILLNWYYVINSYYAVMNSHKPSRSLRVSTIPMPKNRVQTVLLVVATNTIVLHPACSSNYLDVRVPTICICIRRPSSKLQIEDLLWQSCMLVLQVPKFSPPY